MNVYGWVRKTGGVSWYRVQEPLRGLALSGHATSYGPNLNYGRLSELDVVVTSVHGEAEASVGWETMARLPARPFMVYDIDDDVWNFREGLHQYEYWQDEELLRNVQSGIACADLVITPSPILAERISALNPNVQVYGNYVPERLIQTLRREPNQFVIGYQGGDTHKYDIAVAGPEMFRFLITNRDVRMRIWGASSYDGICADRVELTPWERNINTYYRSLHMSVGLAPLEHTAFNEAKSAIKAVEYAALGIPAIVSDCAPYRDTVIDGVTGLVVGKGQWYDALTLLKTDPLTRAYMAQNAWKHALDWTTEHNAERYADILRKGMHG